MDHGKLSDWLKIGLQRTVSGGFFATILRTDRLNEALSVLPERGVCVLPLWPRAGEMSKRVIVQVRKGSGTPFALLPGLVLHQENGAWTSESEAVLRRGEALALSGARL
jgi:tRNA1(Val) A37 N6-methylase TrmN6